MQKKIYTSTTESGKKALFVSGLGEYSLSDTLECGQCFRFDRIDGEYEHQYFGMVGSHPVCVAQRARGELLFIGADERDYDEYLCHYFALDVDWAEINKKIEASLDSAFMREATRFGAGIAILRQDVWEALFSFIISQNNNIPRIKKNIRTVCALYGEKRGSDCASCDECGGCYTFPSAQDILKNPSLLKEAKLGFRERYLIDAATRVSNGDVDLESVRHPADFTVAHDTLCRICGVGDKVCSCVLLFGAGHLDAFPIDVWMKRAIDDYFDGSLDASKFGSYAGVAQQYIFHYIRNITAKADKK